MHVQDYITILATLHALQKYKIQDFARSFHYLWLIGHFTLSYGLSVISLSVVDWSHAALNNQSS